MSKKTILPTSIKIPSRGDRVKAKDIQNLATQIKRVSRSGRENYTGAFYRAPDSPFMPKLRGKKMIRKPMKLHSQKATLSNAESPMVTR